jgi:hypothetical protein
MKTPMEGRVPLEGGRNDNEIQEHNAGAGRLGESKCTLRGWWYTRAGK